MWEDVTLPALLAPLTLWDAGALGLLALGWFGLGYWIEHAPARFASVSSLMAQYRRDWMARMAERDTRIFDAQIIASLRQGTNFFASTCVLALGGVLALMGNTEPLTMLADEIAPGHAEDLAFQVRLMPVVVFLTTAFLRFVWASRVFGYCAVVMASVSNDPADPEGPPRAAQAAELNIRAAANFNRGLRGMYFALASVAWVLGAVALGAAALVAIWVVWSREFASAPRRILRGEEP